MYLMLLPVSSSLVMKGFRSWGMLSKSLSGHDTMSSWQWQRLSQELLDRGSRVEMVDGDDVTSEDNKMNAKNIGMTRKRGGFTWQMWINWWQSCALRYYCYISNSLAVDLQSLQQLGLENVTHVNPVSAPSTLRFVCALRIMWTIKTIFLSATLN